MKNEGSIQVDWRRFGALAWLRRKQWWYFEGLDPERELYFVFLALEGIPSSYVSLKWIDYGRGTRWTEDHLGSFRAAPGDAVDVLAEGKWGRVQFDGCAEAGWQIRVDTPRLKADCRQTPQVGPYYDHLLTQHLDYHIHQFVLNRCEGKINVEGQVTDFSGYGYHEHNWGVQPRHSTAHWLHFWAADTSATDKSATDMAGVVLSCHYDAGVPHHYTFLWADGCEHSLVSPAQFSFNPAEPQTPWSVRSPDLELNLSPIAGHKTRMRIPPWPAYVDVDYREQIARVNGTAWVHGEPKAIDGIGKMDWNWNRW